jgi:hypothetical protein
MPNVGRSFAKRSRTIAPPSTAFNPFMQAANAPTPGTTNPSASSATERSDVTTTSLPAVANARSADLRFPDP